MIPLLIPFLGNNKGTIKSDKEKTVRNDGMRKSEITETAVKPNSDDTVKMSNLTKEVKSENMIEKIDESTSARMFRHIPF